MNFDAILFDCDGVLVDSEPLTHGVLVQMLGEAGWHLTLEQCMARFLGKAVRDERVAIEQHTGQPLTEAWMAEFYARRNTELQARLVAIAGAHDAVEAAHAHAGQRIACASGADRFKVEMQLAQVGLMPWFDGRIFSGQEMQRSKPAPDVYLAAASHLGAAGARCLVIEDTTTGVTAGMAAGATVWAYCPLPEQGPALMQAGARHLFARMADLPALLAAV